MPVGSIYDLGLSRSQSTAMDICISLLDDVEMLQRLCRMRFICPMNSVRRQYSDASMNHTLIFEASRKTPTVLCRNKLSSMISCLHHVRYHFTTSKKEFTNSMQYQQIGRGAGKSLFVSVMFGLADPSHLIVKLTI